MSFDEADAEGDTSEIEDRPIPIVGRSSLLPNKAASGRDQDLADLAALERTEP